MQIWKTIRVFISSTFRDMHAERDFLVRFVFPELRERCAKRNLHLIDVDLRWGVSEEEATQGKLIEICFDEIERCRPFFIGLLGERYGWIPPKFEASDDENFHWLKDYPEYSITALEIYYGTLHNKKMKSQAFFYFRDANFLKEVPIEKRADFLPENDEAAQKLAVLKEKIKAKKYPIFENYPCRYDGINESGQVKIADLEEFGKRVLEDLWTAICLEHFHEETPADDLASERHFHETFIENRIGRFVGRRDILDKLHEFTDSEDENSLVVTGAAGCGKSTILAKFAKEYKEKHPEEFVLTNFIGASPGSTDVRRVLLRICRELKRNFEIQEEIPTDYYDLKQAFVRFLGKAAEHGKILFVVDALDQLDESPFANHLEWLPITLPKGLKIVVSTLEGNYFEVLRRRKSPPQEVLVGSLTENERREIVTKTLETYRKTLDEHQMRLLLKKAASDNPLFLIVACEELRVYGDFDTVSGKLESLAEQVETLFGQVLKRVEDDHGKNLVTNALRFLECSRYGLLESEILELLARDGEKQLPQAVWARFYRSLKFYLRPSGSDENQSGEGLLDFFHRQLSKAVRQKYLVVKEDEIVVHQRLARYFQLKADPKADKTWSEDYPRGLSELSHHQLSGKLYEDLFQTARDEVFLGKQGEIFADDPEIQLQTFQNAVIGSADIDNASGIAEFMFRHCRHLRKFTHEHAFKLFRETGNLEKAINLCLIWLLKNKQIGFLQFLWLAWELKKKGYFDDAGKLLLILAESKGQLPLAGKIKQLLSAIALSQMSELDFDCYTSLRKSLLDDDGNFYLCKKLVSSDIAKKTPVSETKIKVALTVAADVGSHLYATHKPDAYVAIALAQAQIGMKVDETFELAVKAMNEQPNEILREIHSKAIATAQAKTGRYKDAFNTAKKIDNPYYIEEIHKTIAESQAKFGEYDDALKTVELLKEDSVKIDTYVFILKKLARVSNYDDNLLPPDKMVFGYKDDEIYFAIVESQTGNGKFEESLKTAGKINREYMKIKAYILIAEAREKSKKDGQEALNYAIDIAKDVKDPINKTKAFLLIAISQKRLGQSITETLNLILELVEKFTEMKEKANAYVSIASIQMNSPQNAAEALELALLNLTGTTDTFQKVKTALSIASAQARIKENTAEAFDLAIKTCSKLDLRRDEERAFELIVQTQAKLGKYADVLRMIEKLENEDDQFKIYQSIAEVYGEKDSDAFFDLALKLSSTPQEDSQIAFQKIKTFTSILSTQINAKKPVTISFDPALRTVEKIRDMERKVEAFGLIASVLIKNGQDATSVLDSALKTAGEIDYEGSRVRAYVLIALVQFEARIDPAKTFDLALKALDNDKRWNGKHYETLAIGQAQTGNYREALRTAEKITELERQTNVYMQVATLQARSGEYTNALKTASQIKDTHSRDRTYIPIVAGMAFDGKYKSALQEAENINDPECKAWALCGVAEAYAEAKRYNDALEIAGEIPDSEWKAEAIEIVASTQTRNGDFENALKTIAKIEDVYWRAGAYKTIGLIQIDNEKDVAEAFDLALNTIKEIEDLDEKEEMYISITREIVKTGKDPAKVFDKDFKVLEEIGGETLKARVVKVIEHWQTRKNDELTFPDISVDEGSQQDNNRELVSQKAEVQTNFEQVRRFVGNFEETFKVSSSFLVGENNSIPQISSVSAKKDNKSLLIDRSIRSSYYLKSCYQMSEVLAAAYPNQRDAIIEVVNRELAVFDF